MPWALAALATRNLMACTSRRTSWIDRHTDVRVSTM